MARLVERYWEPSFASGLPRRERQGCTYRAYVPDEVARRSWQFDGETAAALSEAEAALGREHRSGALADTEVLARLLLRAEAVASSRIEGLEVGGRRLLRAEAAIELGERQMDVTAEEVLANIHAMAWSIERVTVGGEITPELLLEVHLRLLAGTRAAEHAGQFRTTQNWIGGSAFNPCSAVFVPPPPEDVERLIADLCAFCNEDALPPVAQAAIAHAQFETIHPFADGNGRTGRALIHMVLRRRGLARTTLPPVSLVLAAWADGYVAALTETRGLGDLESEPRRAGLNAWIVLFAAACVRSARDIDVYELAVAEIEREWRASIGTVRRDSAADRLLRALPGLPVFTVAGASSRIGRSFQATNLAVQRLVVAGILRPVRVGRRNRAFEAREIIDRFGDLERRLASPGGDTRSSPPVRPVPRRRQGG